MPALPAIKDAVVGLIGMGEMGRMYADRLSRTPGHCARINVCDLPDRYDSLVDYCRDKPRLVPLRDGHLVARESDFVVYSVEAAYIDQVVAQYGPSTKVGAIVAGQTSVKAPERKAFEQHLPADTHIVSIHSLHGPTVPSDNQALVRPFPPPSFSPSALERLADLRARAPLMQIVIQHRASAEHVEFVKQLLAPLNSRYVDLSYDEHDEVTANTQAVTHAAFLSYVLVLLPLPLSPSPSLSLPLPPSPSLSLSFSPSPSIPSFLSLALAFPLNFAPNSLLALSLPPWLSS